MTYKQDVYIRLGDFDPSRLVFEPPEVNEYNGITTTGSQLYYKDENDEPCVLYLELPEQETFGPSENYDLGKKEEDRTIDDLKGYQISYPLTSMKTLDSPTEDEQYTETVANTLVDKACEYIYKLKCEHDKNPDDVSDWDTLPDNCQSAWRNAKSPDDIKMVFKDIFQHPKKEVSSKGKTKKVPDTEKPKKAYWKLLSKGKGTDCTITAWFYGPGDQKENPLKYVSRKGSSSRGILQPWIKVSKVYFGGHGTTPNVASLTIKVVEATFTPTSGQSRKRLCRRNDAPIVEADVQTPKFVDEPDEDVFDSMAEKLRAKANEDDSELGEESEELEEESEELEEEKPKKRKRKKKTSD